jgi:propanol-preferring alcohol dehydrogenase
VRAWVLEGVGEPLRLRERPALRPAPGQLHLEVRACAVCRTDLHIVDGELPGTSLPRVPGHEIVGRVLALGAGVSGWQVGDRAGVPWLAWTCGA